MEKLTSPSRRKIATLSLLTIFLCFLATAAISFYSLSKVKDATVQNEARLITANINAHIRDFLATQITAATPATMSDPTRPETVVPSGFSLSPEKA